MPLNTVLFATSLFLIAFFFALKEREVYSGETTFITRFLERRSPGTEQIWRSVRARARVWLSECYDTIERFLKTFTLRTLLTLRFIVVYIADKMIRAVKGEKMLDLRGGAASMYLKHLRDHKDTNGRAPEESNS